LSPVAGRWPSPRPSLAFRRRRLGLRGFPELSTVRRPKPLDAGPRDLVLPFKALDCALVPARAVTSSLGIRSESPFHRHAPCVSTPGSKLPSARRLPFRRAWSAFAVSRRHDGLLHTRGCRFVAPCCRSGVHRVSLAHVLHRSTRGGSGHRPMSAFPAMRFTPSEDFPSPAAAPHHCGRCLLAVTVAPRRHRGRSLGVATERDKTSDAVMLRSAEADPHVTVRVVRSPGRSRQTDAARKPACPRPRRSTIADPGSNHRRGWPAPPVLPSTSTPPGGGAAAAPLPKPRSRSFGGNPPRRSGMGARARRTSRRAAGYKALLR
jgi:hypothetical protein